MMVDVRGLVCVCVWSVECGKKQKGGCLANPLDGRLKQRSQA